MSIGSVDFNKSIKMNRVLVTFHIVFLILELSLQIEAILSSSAQLIWIILISVTIITSFIITNIISIIWIHQTMDFHGRRYGHIVCILSHMIQIGIIWRYFKIIMTNDKQDIQELFLLRVIQTSVQSIAFIVFHGSGLYVNELNNPVSYISIVISFLSILFVYTCYQVNGLFKEKKVLHVIPRIFTFIAVKMFLLASRCLCFIMSICTLKIWVLLCISVHFLTYSVFIFVIRTLGYNSKTNRDNILNALKLGSQVTDYFFPYHVTATSEIVLFYVIIAVENVILSLICYLSDNDLPYKTILFGLTLGSYLIGVLLLCVFMKCVKEERKRDKNIDDKITTITNINDSFHNTSRSNEEAIQINNSSNISAAATTTTTTTTDGTPHVVTNDHSVLSHSNGADIIIIKDDIDISNGEALVDSHWKAVEQNKRIQQTDEDGSGYFSADTIDLVTKGCFVVSDSYTIPDSGYYSYGGTLSSNSELSIIPNHNSSHSLSSYPQLLVTTAKINNDDSCANDLSDESLEAASTSSSTSHIPEDSSLSSPSSNNSVHSNNNQHTNKQQIESYENITENIKEMKGNVKNCMGAKEITSAICVKFGQGDKGVRNPALERVYKEWYSINDSSTYTTSDSLSRYDFSVTSSVCSTCDELDQSDDSETDYTMTWPPSNRVNRHNLRLLPSADNSTNQQVQHWLQKIGKFANEMEDINTANNNMERANPTFKSLTLGRNNRINGKHKAPVIKAAAKNALRTLCTANAHKQKQPLYPNTVNVSTQSNKDLPLRGSESIV